ncbi:hypothetical protein ACEZCY_05520 [Streptacidiphilus sp. N1-12]|uniref:YcxB-like protein domain-containing protein n=2 Tax=Streptacidiphilus alkalitolerans TaxID=3342712 RepID=A0ABV6V551_9ACTN
MWVFLLVPSGTRIIPKSAVEPDQQEAFTAQLREWAGTKYRVRDK